MSVPVTVQHRDDYEPGTRKPKLIKKDIWLVEITIPKYLINDIRQGSVELENQDVDLADLDQAYEQDLDTEAYEEGA